ESPRRHRAAARGQGDGLDPVARLRDPRGREGHLRPGASSPAGASRRGRAAGSGRGHRRAARSLPRARAAVTRRALALLAVPLVVIALGATTAWLLGLGLALLTIATLTVLIDSR